MKPPISAAQVKLRLAITVLFCFVFLGQACDRLSPSIIPNLFPSSTPAATQSPEEQVVTFILDSIIGVNDLQGENLIIYGPTIKTAADMLLVNRDLPYHIWRTEGGKLIDKGNDPAAVTDFYNLPDTDDKGWLIGFSIISIDATTDEAQVYIERNCGPTCGTGTMYTLHYTQVNQWEIKDQKMLWVS